MAWEMVVFEGGKRLIDFFVDPAAKKKEEEYQKERLELASQLGRSVGDIELDIQRETLASGMRTESERSLSEVLRDYEFAEPQQPTVYQLGPAKEPTFAEKVNVFIERLIEQIMKALQLH